MLAWNCRARTSHTKQCEVTWLDSLKFGSGNYRIHSWVRFYGQVGMPAQFGEFYFIKSTKILNKQRVRGLCNFNFFLNDTSRIFVCFDNIIVILQVSQGFSWLRRPYGMTPSSHRKVIGNHDNQINWKENTFIPVVGTFPADSPGPLDRVWGQ